MYRVLVWQVGTKINLFQTYKTTNTREINSKAVDGNVDGKEQQIINSK